LRLSACRYLLRSSLPYFFLNPVGHFGLTAVTFFVTFPLRQVIVNNFDLEASAGKGEATGVAATSVFLDRFTLMLGVE
jgi:hypothetical protein